MPISPLNQCLLALCGLFLVLLLGLWIVPVDADWADIEMTPPSPSAPVMIQASLTPSPTDNLVNRPIFDQTRRAAAAVGTPVTTSAPPPTLTLAGLLVGSGKRVALIRSPDSKDLVLAHVGDTVSSWQIKEIDSDHVVISANGQTQELRFPTSSGAADALPGTGTVTAPGVHSY
jgi:type II secretory pathway component PulC